MNLYTHRAWPMGRRDYILEWSRTFSAYKKWSNFQSLFNDFGFLIDIILKVMSGCSASFTMSSAQEKVTTFWERSG